MKYLVARPGCLSLPKFQEVNFRRCTELGSDPWGGYNDGGAAGFADEADVTTLFQNTPYALSDEGSAYMWEAPASWGVQYASDCVPYISLDGQRFDPDPNPINGHQSWGNGKIRWTIYKTADEIPKLGYVYEKTKELDTDGRLYSSKFDGKYYGDGWYTLDTPYVEVVYTGFNATPQGVLKENAATSSVISGEFVFPDHYCQRNSSTGYTELSGYPDDSKVIHLGLPVWKGMLLNLTDDHECTIVGVPFFNQELSAMDMEYVWTAGTGSYYAPRNYYRYYDYTNRYGTNLSGEVADVRTIFPRNHLSGWWEFEPVDSLHVGDTLNLNFYKGDSGQALGNASFTLTEFVQCYSTTLNCYVSPDTSEKRTMDVGMLLGVFNVGTMIY